MGLYRDETGRVIEIDDRFADARGYTPISPVEEGELISQKAEQQLGQERGIVGDINAFGTGFLGAVTMGGTDYLLGKTLTPEQRRRVLAEIEAHPTLHAAGELGGAIVSTMDGMGGTPAGYLSNVAGRQVERSLARGGVRGTATALGTMGAEAAAQTAGMYLGHAALEDKEVTAEGLTGALGTGFAFGTGAGGAALGVIKGTVAARRMFSRVMQGEKAAKDAESAWSIASQEALEADRVTAQAAETKLENIRKAKMEALRGRNEAKAAAQEAALNVPPRPGKQPAVPDFEAGIPTDVIPKEKLPGDFETDIPTDVQRVEKPQGGMPTSVFRKPSELEGPLPLDEGIAGAAGGQVTSVRRSPLEAEGPDPLIDVGAQPAGEATSVFKAKPQLASEEQKARAMELFDKLNEGKAPLKPSLPKTAADVVDETVSTVSAKDIEAHGWESNSIPGKDKVKTDKGRAAIKEGQKDAIKIAVSPSGKYVLEDGTHRLAAAIEQGKDIKVQWFKGAKGLDEATSAHVVKPASAAPAAPRMTWKEFQQSKMGEYMKSEGGHAGAMKRIGKEWREYNAAKPAGSLEEQLAGTKKALDEGKALKDIKGEKPVKSKSDAGMPEVGQIGRGQRKPGELIDEWLTEKADHDATLGIRSDADEWLSTRRPGDPLSEVKKIEDIKGGHQLRNRRDSDVVRGMKERTQETLSEIRYKATEDLLGPQMAKEEQRLADVVDEYRAARKDLEDHLMQFDEGFVKPGELEVGIDRKAADAFDDEMGVPTRDTEGFPRTGEGQPPPDHAPRPDFNGDKTRPGKRAVDMLDDAHEEALLRARHASDPAEAGRAIQEADELEQLLEGLAVDHVQNARGRAGERSAEFLDALAEGVKKVERYEKASARLAEEVGAEAHPLSAEKTKMMRAAESAGEKRVWDRTARATDDLADGTVVDAEGAYKAGRAAKVEAKRNYIGAQRKYDELSAQHIEAQNELAAANKKVKAGEKAKKEALRADAKAAKAAQVGEKTGISDIGGILEILDIPGMPKPSDLPVVGPLLGAYLKFRTLRKAVGKKMGVVPATADAKAAVLASQTRDRVARAIDRSIGVAEKAVKGALPKAPLIAGVLAARIYDDGGPEPKKGASVPELAAARMREVLAYVNTPNAIEMDVRREMRHVTDPDLIAAVELARRNAFGYLASTLPPVPDHSVLNQVDYLPSPAEAMKFGRRLEAINDPAGVFEKLAHERELLSLEAAEALRKVYPRMFGEAQARLLERAAEGKLNVPMRQRVQLSLMYQVPLDASLDPDNLKITQSVYERKPSSPAYNAGAPGAAPQGPTAQPAIANPVNISQAMTPSIDRSR